MCKFRCRWSCRLQTLLVLKKICHLLIIIIVVILFSDSVTNVFEIGVNSANKAVNKTQSNAIQILNNFNPLSIVGRK